MSLINVGYDASGNGNNWTPTNIDQNTSGTGADVLVDVPTLWGTDTGVGGEVRGNYCTWNPLNAKSGMTPSNGNLTLTATTDGSAIVATMGLPSGKWYFEDTRTSGTGNYAVGFAFLGVTSGQVSALPFNIGYSTTTVGVYQNGQVYYNSSNQFSGTAQSVGGVRMIAIDVDAGKMWSGYNGTWDNSGVPASGTGAVFSSIPAGGVIPVFGDSATQTEVHDFNFGQRPFAYTAPSGFKALCTQNLPDPAIADGSQYMDALIWTGDNSSTGTTKNQTGLAFQPDLVWIKNRTNSYWHNLYDSVRGAGSSKNLSSNTTNAEGNSASLYGYLSAFNSDGFQTTNGSDATNPGIWVNQNTENFVAWNWKAGGTGVSNTAGSITSTVSANTTAGFSIVTYTGTGADATVGHGLGATPSMIIVKNRSISASWFVYHTSLGKNKYVLLDTTGAAATDTDTWNDTAPTSTVFSLGGQFQTDGSGNSLVAYCFAPVSGFSAFGSYVGNGSSDGPFVYTGLRPKYYILKNITSGQSWSVQDTARSSYNVGSAVLFPNSSNAEATGTDYVDILSNGFKIRHTSAAGNNNNSGDTYIYAAFAENPFKYALAR